MSAFASVPRLSLLAVILACCLMIPACGKSKLTKENFDKINNGMTLQEVEAVLGKGSKDEGDGSNVAAQVGVAIEAPSASKAIETYVWESGKKKITVYVTTGKVSGKRAEGL